MIVEETPKLKKQKKGGMQMMMVMPDQILERPKIS